MTHSGSPANAAGVHSCPGARHLRAVTETDGATSNELLQGIPTIVGPWEPPSVELYEVIVDGLRNMDAATNLPAAGVSNPPAAGGQPMKEYDDE